MPIFLNTSWIDLSLKWPGKTYAHTNDHVTESIQIIATGKKTPYRETREEYNIHTAHCLHTF